MSRVVKLIKARVEEVFAYEGQEVYQVRPMAVPPFPILGEEHPNDLVHLENVKIRNFRQVIHGVRHDEYIAYTKDFLDLVEAPLQRHEERKIKRAQEETEIQRRRFIKLTRAPLWTRIKWVFTGVR